MNWTDADEAELLKRYSPSDDFEMTEEMIEYVQVEEPSTWDPAFRRAFARACRGGPFVWEHYPSLGAQPAPPTEGRHVSGVYAIDWERELHGRSLSWYAGLAEMADQTSQSRRQFEMEFDHDVCRALIGMIVQRDERIEELETTLRTIARVTGGE